MKSYMVVMLTKDSNIDRRIIQEADSLEAVGWKVTIIAMPKTTKNFSDDKRVIRLSFYPKTYSNNLLLFLFYFFKWVNKYLFLSSAARILMRKLAWLVTDIEKFYLNMFRITVDKYKPSVFLAHDLPTLPIACYAASKCNAKVVYDSHELYVEQEFSNLEKRKWIKLEQKYIGHCDSIITVNNPIAQELQQRYSLSSDKLYVISNALPYKNRVNINSKIFHQKFGLKDQSKIVLFQGGLSHNRNLEKLVESMTYVQNPLINLVILGDGPLKKLLQTIAIKHNLTKKVHFHQAVTQQELLSYTPCADLGVIPYQATCLNNYYSTPNKLFEFIAAEIPILSAKLPSIENILNEFQIGLATDFASPSQISKALDSLFENEQILKTYKENMNKASKEIVWEDKKFTSIFEAYK